jgi:hypothetical protein
MPVLKVYNASTSSWEDVSYEVSPLTTKGDLLTFGTALDRLPVGSDGQVITADSTQADGLKWSTPASGGGGESEEYLPYDTDASQVWYRTVDDTISNALGGGTSSATLLTGDQKVDLNSIQISAGYHNFEWPQCFWFNFPHAVQIDNFCILYGYADGRAGNFSNLVIQASNDSTDGADGTWSTGTWNTDLIPAYDGTKEQNTRAVTFDIPSYTWIRIGTTGVPWSASPLIYSILLGYIAIPNNTPLTTKGDLLTFGTQLNRLPVGSDGQVLTADSTQADGLKWSTPASGGGGSGSGGPTIGAQAAMNTPISIANGGSGVRLAMDTKNYDTNGIIDLINHPTRLTCQTSGIYQINASTHWSPYGAGGRWMGFFKNDNFLDIGQAFEAGDTEVMMTSSFELALTTGDYLELQVFQSSSVTISISVPQFGMRLVTDSGGSGWQDVALVPPASPSNYNDEFNGASIDPSWVPVDVTSYAQTYTQKNGVLSVLCKDRGVVLSALLKPFTGLTPPVTLECAFRAFSPGNDIFPSPGLCFAESVDYGGSAGKKIVTALQGIGGKTFQNWQICDWTDFSTRNAYYEGPTGMLISPFYFMRLVWVATNTWRMLVSCDGITWIQVGADQTRTCAPTYFGLAMTGSDNPGPDFMITYEYFRVYQG